MSSSDFAAATYALLGRFDCDPQSTLAPTLKKSLMVARALQRRAHELQTPEERKQQTELDRMIQNPTDKATLTAMTDQAFRSHTAARSADQLLHILDVQGVPRFFSPLERTLLHGFHSFGDYLPGVTIPLVKEKMRRETANVIIPAEPEVLCAHLEMRRQEGVRMNVNLLGEAILGQAEADRRLEQYLAALQLDEVEVMSVKISTIYSQISSLARSHTIANLCERLELLYRAAAKSTFVRHDGSRVAKFVYLDMEEYRDLSLTAEVFMRTLDRPGMAGVSAGIALQAYVPDSFRWQRVLTEWAKRRVESGGEPITVRIVKGANMEMERVEASIGGWPQAPFKTKPETDANYKRMLQHAIAPDHLAAVRVGIASHNLFDVSYGLVLAAESDGPTQIQFEMLEGMANHQRRALHELTSNVLLYAPACCKEDFIHAIGYLVRRLDENTGPENFLRHAFNIAVDSAAWKRLEQGFIESFSLIDSLPDQPRRGQDRRAEEWKSDDETARRDVFDNEPDTDFSLPANSAWAESIVQKWSRLHGELAIEVPLRIAGRHLTDAREAGQCEDPSRPGTMVGRLWLADESDVEAAVRFANDDPGGWRQLDVTQRHQVLRRAAMQIRQSRGDLVGAAMANGGKTVLEADPEVSEAVDFVEFYSECARRFESIPGVQATPRGIVVVVSPWNFPIAIPCGGVAAALAAGNCVILKPATPAVLVAHLLCECFFRAGVPASALQLMPCRGGSVGAELVSHPMVDTVILTGGTETALHMMDRKPNMRLMAETGGKNATIVTAMADRDQAIKHVIRSAFGHSGQKCSATSLLLLEDEIYHDAAFRDSLVDAAKSLRVGGVWDLPTRIGPLITPPTGDLNRGLKELEPGESWALRPHCVDESDRLFSPGIKWNVSRGSYTHLTEFFGPLLGVMSFRHLAEAIEIVNETGYGLTSGLESLDDREQTIWLNGIRAGNLYVNRPTTGAIVLRQPFGGLGKSASGPGIKAGGPNYVAPLYHFAPDHHDVGEWSIESIANPSLQQFTVELLKGSDIDRELLAGAISSFDRAASDEFLQSHDHFRLIGQDNIRRYLPIVPLYIRVDRRDSWREIVLRAVAAQAVGGRSIVSYPPQVHAAWIQRLHDMTESWAGDIEFIEQTDADLAESIEWGGAGRIRYAAPERVPGLIRRAVIGQSVHVADSPVMEIGRIELLWYVQEQSISIDYHRYGNLGVRGDESRCPTR